MSIEKTKTKIRNFCKANNGVAIYLDKYNPIKVWKVIREDNRHYTLEQHLNGRFYGASYRVGLKHIASVLEGQI